MGLGEEGEERLLFLPPAPRGFVALLVFFLPASRRAERGRGARSPGPIVPAGCLGVPPGCLGVPPVPGSHPGLLVMRRAQPVSWRTALFTHSFNSSSPSLAGDTGPGWLSAGRLSCRFLSQCLHFKRRTSLSTEQESNRWLAWFAWNCSGNVELPWFGRTRLRL